MQHRRVLLGQEIMETQGIGPIYTLDDYDMNDNASDIGPPRALLGDVQTPFMQAVRDGVFTQSQLAAFAGNGMSVPVVGAAMAFVLACTVPA